MKRLWNNNALISQYVYVVQAIQQKTDPRRTASLMALHFRVF